VFNTAPRRGRIGIHAEPCIRIKRKVRGWGGAGSGDPAPLARQGGAHDRRERYPSKSTPGTGGAGAHRHSQQASARMLTRYGVACIVTVVIVAAGLYARTGSVAWALAVAVVTTAALASQNRSTHTWDRQWERNG